MGYRNEAAFSRAMVEALRRKRWFIQRIESGTTGKGIPDIYAIAPYRKQSMWIELKRENVDFNPYGPNPVHWRPGQLSWLHEVSGYGIPCHTLIAYNNVIALVGHWKNLPKNNTIQVPYNLVVTRPTVAKMAELMTKFAEGGSSYDRG